MLSQEVEATFGLHLYNVQRIMLETLFDMFFDILFQHPHDPPAPVDVYGLTVNPNLVI